MRGQGYYATEREIVAIIRRMDTSCAASVSYSDFSDFVRGHGSADYSASHASSASSSGRPKSADRTASPKKLSDSLTKTRASSANRTSPKKKKACCDDCAKTGSSCAKPIELPRMCSPSLYCRPSVCCECPCTPYSYCRPYSPPLCRPCPPSICKPCGPVLSSPQEYDLVKGLYDIIKEERDLESAK